MLLIFFIKGLTLPGAVNGITYYVTPVWAKLAEPQVILKCNLNDLHTTNFDVTNSPTNLISRNALPVLIHPIGINVQFTI